MSVLGAFLGVGLIVDIKVENPQYLLGIILALSAALFTGVVYIIIRKLNTFNTPNNVQ